MKDETAFAADDADLHAYVDGRLDADARARVQDRLAIDSAAAEAVATWSTQNAALRALHASALDEPVPAHLLRAAGELQQRNRRVAQWARWGGMAASIVLAVAVGWFGHAQWENLRGTGTVARGPSEFARQAVVAHVVYSPEVRHPVEVTAAQHEHLVQWLSKRLGRPLKVPNLSTQGYELVGGRLLPGDQGARAQFMYQNTGGERITLYVGAVTAGNSSAPAGETAFRFTQDGAVAGFYWVDQGFGYALAGKLPRGALQALAENVYRQL